MQVTVRREKHHSGAGAKTFREHKNPVDRFAFFDDRWEQASCLLVVRLYFTGGLIAN